MASVPATLRPCVLLRGNFSRVSRHRVGLEHATGLMRTLVNERFALMTNSLCTYQGASRVCSDARTKVFLPPDLDKNLLFSSYFSKVPRAKVITGEAVPSSAELSVSSGETENCEGKENEDLDNPFGWTIKLLYDGDCPLCMKEVNFLRGRNKTYQVIKFVDISGDSYSPKENADLSYEKAMGRIHGILRDGTVLSGVPVFRKVYEEVGLGWVYAITSIEPIGRLADALYDVWADYRLPLTGRPSLLEVLETRRQKKALRENCDEDRCETGQKK